MKRLFLMLVSLIMTLPLHAQEQTLISGPIDNGGFGGPVVKFSQIDSRFALLVGGYGGWLINHSFMIGGGGFGLANNIRGSRAAQIYCGTGDNLRLQFGYGGFMLEYIGEPNSLIHYNVSKLIGAVGSITTTSKTHPSRTTTISAMRPPASCSTRVPAPNLT